MQSSGSPARGCWATALLLVACADPLLPSADPRWNTPAAACPAAPAGHVTFEPARLRFVNPDGRELTFRAELARSPEAQARGMMYRRELPLDRALVFPSAAPEDARFWMRHTCLALDLVWVGADGLVAGVQTAPALEEVPRGIGIPTLHVVELGAGVAAANGLTVGSRMVLEP